MSSHNVYAFIRTPYTHIPKLAPVSRYSFPQMCEKQHFCLTQICSAMNKKKGRILWGNTSAFNCFKCTYAKTAANFITHSMQTRLSNSPVSTHQTKRIPPKWLVKQLPHSAGTIVVISDAIIARLHKQSVELCYKPQTLLRN